MRREQQGALVKVKVDSEVKSGLGIGGEGVKTLCRRYSRK
jgi:hypothetical protein